MMQIFVKGSKTMALQVRKHDTIVILKKKVEALLHIPLSDIILNYGTKILAADQCTLGDYNLVNNATVHLSIRLLGGNTDNSEKAKVRNIVFLPL